jgi:hypothetical protein
MMDCSSTDGRSFGVAHSIGHAWHGHLFEQEIANHGLPPVLNLLAADGPDAPLKRINQPLLAGIVNRLRAIIPEKFPDPGH